ncbi:MAG: hypothetical protein IT305_32790 [Chloroflexi bacterium]|nr:hypothetical protein [Chloroflexota bacterium]
MAVKVDASERCGSLGDVTVRITCDDAIQQRRIVALWKRLFALEAGSATSDETVSLHFGSTSPGPRRADLGEEISCSTDVRVWRTERGSFVQSGASTLDLDLVTGSGVGGLGGGFWAQPLHRQRGFFLIGLLSLLHARERFGLHAGAVTRGGGGCLFVGPSGSGKTTLTAALVRQGWSYLSDDALVLSANSDGIAAHAFRRGFSCVPTIAAHFTELRDALVRSPVLPGGKRLVDADPVYPDRFTPRCVPRTILFPRIVSEPHSRLVPLDETAAMVGLLEQSPGIARSRASAHRQLAVLRRLVQQASGYRLLLGADLLADRGAVPRMLADLMQER